MIDTISRAIAQTPGCVLLDVDAGPSTNRTVYTFVGTPESIVEGALSAARAAWRLIDMSRHRGKGVRGVEWREHRGRSWLWGGAGWESRMPLPGVRLWGDPWEGAAVPVELGVLSGCSWEKSQLLWIRTCHSPRTQTRWLCWARSRFSGHMGLCQVLAAWRG